MDQLPTWVYVAIAGGSMTVISLILRSVISKLVDYIFSPVQEIKTMRKDIQSIDKRVTVCEGNHKSMADMVLSLKEDLGYIRSRLDVMIDMHTEKKG